MSCPLTRDLTPIKRLICASTGLTASIAGMYGLVRHGLSYLEKRNNKTEEEKIKENDDADALVEYLKPVLTACGNVALFCDDHPKTVIGFSGSLSALYAIGTVGVGFMYIERIRSAQTCCAIIGSSSLYSVGAVVGASTSVMFGKYTSKKYKEYNDRLQETYY